MEDITQFIGVIKVMKRRQNYKKDLPIHDWFLTNVPIMVQDLKKHFEACKRRWLRILNNMQQSFVNSRRETCKYNNPYGEDYSKAFHENIKKYGMKINELSGKDYKAIAKLYHDEEKKIEMLVEHDRKKAIRLFIKYFDYL